jgi:hypothetical protein
MWWDDSVRDIYFQALSHGADISIIEIPEEIEKEILSGKTEYKVINKKLEKINDYI